MATLLSVETENGYVLIEAWRPTSDVIAIASLEDSVLELKEAIKGKLRPVLELAREVRQELATLAVDSAEVEFGFAFTSKGSAYVVAVEAEATFKVKLMFKSKP